MRFNGHDSDRFDGNHLIYVAEPVSSRVHTERYGSVLDSTLRQSVSLRLYVERVGSG